MASRIGPDADASPYASRSGAPPISRVARRSNRATARLTSAKPLHSVAAAALAEPTDVKTIRLASGVCPSPGTRIGRRELRNVQQLARHVFLTTAGAGEGPPAGDRLFPPVDRPAVGRQARAGAAQPV